MENATSLPPVLTPVTFDGESWVLFTDLLNAANLSDPKAANTKCEIEPAIERTALPGFDQRERYIKMRDIPAFLGRYRRLSPEQSTAFARILSGFDSDIKNELSEQLPSENAGTSDNNAQSYRAMPRQMRGVYPANTARKPGQNARSNTLKAWGEKWGEFYASPLVAYLALTGLVIALAVLHASAGWRMLPNLPKWEILALSVLMQSIVLVGTVNANFFKKDRQYQWFLAGFATYDMLMSACNFFYGYDPTVFTRNAALPDVIIGITDLGIRTGFTVAFPLATVFFAALVKKMRANK
ncbi:MAG: hypothetical protein R3D58_13035 [Saprospiraceae bacterium]